MKRRIYTFQGLEPEVVAVTFAKSSRSPEPFDKIAAELDEDKSRKFHERWVVGYGHGSVAEHAVLSIAIENVSILATKVIEDNRLASYTEKSSRYQVFDKNKYFKPELNPELEKLYVETADYILDTYTELVEKMLEFLKKKYPSEKEIEIRNRALDNVRYLLPVSVLTNLGMTVNARNLEWAIVKLLTHPLPEMNRIGEEVKDAALKRVPTLVKYTRVNEYLGETCKVMEGMGVEGDAVDEQGAVLVEFDPDAEDKLVAGLLYRFSKLPYKQIKEKVKSMDSSEKEKVIDESLKRLGKFDRPLREFEHVEFTFDVLVDYGAFRDIQRHRICTQTNQEFTVEHGYCVPDEIVEAGFKDKYVKCMEKAKSAFMSISKEFPKEAQYIIPLAFNKRVLMKMNLRELFHFIKLRSGKAGHLSYRKIAQQMYHAVSEKLPVIARYIAVDLS